MIEREQPSRLLALPLASVEAGLQPGSFLARCKKQFGPRSIATRAFFNLLLPCRRRASARLFAALHQFSASLFATSSCAPHKCTRPLSPLIPPPAPSPPLLHFQSPAASTLLLLPRESRSPPPAEPLPLGGRYPRSRSSPAHPPAAHSFSPPVLLFHSDSPE